ncbi:sigma-54 interaction domain-containing protein [Alkalilimnicola ehrlichii]|uniref:sigma-54 interaction domain-containing protein n=1 Tax=Alkalilimnicola ehrlichii TaxID=351052 RepID=UPI0005A10F61|nr:sigma 54-interacting transcriptional regulator [Alkalilimnicola ehrlichii]
MTDGDHGQALGALAGLDAALPLVESEAPAQLRRRACRLLARARGLPQVDCLALDTDGRRLSAGAGNAAYRCDDFRHPYAHVIRSGAPLQACIGTLRARMDHPDFQAGMAGLKGDWELLCRPLCDPDAPRGWLGVWALVGPREVVAALDGDPGFMALEGLLCRLWCRLLTAAKAHRQGQDLRHSLQRLGRDTRAHALSGALSRELIGSSPAMSRLRDQVIRAAGTRLAVLLQGETGTGKERVARAIHRHSAQGDGPFVAINCAAIPETLLESELFGHVRGAHSSATRDRTGLLAAADGGTLFLDEIGDMPPALQAKLLRVLESGWYRPLGGGRERRADLRLVSATHQPLTARIREGRFRADLYYRLNQFPLRLPALRERRADIPELADHFAAAYAAREGRPRASLSPTALTHLAARDFPGNLRELRNQVEYGCAMAPAGQPIGPADLPLSETRERTPVEGLPGPAFNLREVVRDYEARLIREKLRQFNGNRAKTAVSLGLPKRTLAHKCRKLQLDEDPA